MSEQYIKLLRFLKELDERKIYYTLEHNRNEAIMVIATVPGERWEIEFMDDDTVEIEKLKSLGKSFPGVKGALPDIDVITEKGGQLFFNKVKAGDKILITKGRNNWEKFTDQAEKTIEAAANNGAKVQYYVDNISQVALEFFKSKNIEVIFNSKHLR